MTGSAALLGELAVARLVGSTGHGRVREVLRRELEARGFVVLDHRFAAAARFPLRGPAGAEGVTLIAVRPRARVTTWLTAHYDSKGQPLSMALRLVWVAATALAMVGTAGALAFGGPFLPWSLAALAFLVGFLVLNRATDGSPGAVDNATGLLTVLATLDALPADASVGALLLDAEELGLVGARALVRERAHLLRGTTVINFDGIDDRGAVTAFVHRPGPLTGRLVAALRGRAWRRLPVVVDGIALAEAASQCVTIMKGNWGTTRVVHTSRDTPGRLTLDGVHAVARVVASVLSTAS
ncbi:MAG TPA: M28 family peptidase [Gemmatimonadales bacterium]